MSEDELREIQCLGHLQAAYKIVNEMPRPQTGDVARRHQHVVHILNKLVLEQWSVVDIIFADANKTTTT